MNNSDYQTIQALARCSFTPGSWVKRFVRDLARYPREKELSERQQAALSKVAWHYRKQVARYGVAVVEKPAAVVEEEQRAEEARREADRKKFEAWNKGEPL